MKKSISRIIGVIMLIVAIVFIMFALSAIRMRHLISLSAWPIRSCSICCVSVPMTSTAAGCRCMCGA